MADLDIAVGQKCYTCARLRITLDDDTMQKLDENALFEGRAIEGLTIENEFALTVPYDVKYGRNPELPEGRGYFIVPLPEEPWATQSIHDPGPSTGSSSALSLAVKWLHDCQRSHQLCNQGRPSSRTLPTRVMDLSGHGLPTGYWRLVQTKASTVQYEPYLTLSHRWGTSQPVMLTQASLATLQRGSKVADLPGLYQDAVAVTKHLSVRYLWIDSLCIFQDSPTDFQIEAGTMQRVYAEALCNLAACTGAKDSMFVTRDPEVVGTNAATMRRSQSGLGKDYLVVERGLWNTEVITTPLSKRAWVFQEELLARRTLYFGPSQISWSCRSGYACETFPSVVSDPGTGGLISRDKIDARAQIRDLLFRALRDLDLEKPADTSTQDMTDSFRGVHNTWADCVNAYTVRDLMHVTDKLPALAGVARLFGTYLNDQYLAGLWRQSLPKSLMWAARESWRDVRRATKYQAPSWSWASMNGPIETSPPNTHRIHSSFQSDDELSTVISVDMEVLGDDEYGSVVSGTLHVRGPVLPLRRDARGWYFDFETWKTASLPESPATSQKGHPPPPPKKGGARKKRGVISKKYGQRHGTAEANVYTPPLPPSIYAPPTHEQVRRVCNIDVKSDTEYISKPNGQGVMTEYIRSLSSEPSLFALFIHSTAYKEPQRDMFSPKIPGWRLHTGGLVLRPVLQGAASASAPVYERAGRFDVNKYSETSLKPWWLPEHWEIFRKPLEDGQEDLSEANATGAGCSDTLSNSGGVRAGEWVEVGSDMMTVLIV